MAKSSHQRIFALKTPRKLRFTPGWEGAVNLTTKEEQMLRPTKSDEASHHSCSYTYGFETFLHRQHVSD